MPRKGEGKHQALLEHEDVKRWYDNLARGSQATADNYLRTLGRFLAAHDFAPGEYVARPTKERDDLLADYVGDLLKKGRAGSYVAVTKKVIRSWLDWHGEQIKRNIKIPNRDKRPTLQDAHIPTQDELKQVLHSSDARGRAVIGLIAFSGLRPQVMGDYTGDDGLRMRHLPDLEIADGEVMFSTVPTQIVVPDDLSKTNHDYFTFLGPEGCEYVSAYLRERLVDGEKLPPDSPVVTPKYADKPFMRSLNVSNIIRKPMRAAGLDEPPYMWRSYFASRCMLAEGDGLTRDYRQFFMGHKGDIEHVYALHKQLPPDTIEEMREAYRAALPHLETRPKESQEDPVLEMVEVMLQARGYSEDQVAEMDLAGKDREDLIEVFRQDPDAQINGNGNAVHQRVVDIDDLDKALAHGWSFKDSLPDGRAVIEKQGSIDGPFP